MKLVITTLLLVSICLSSFSQITLPKMFGNDMVLQRDIPVPVWGHAKPNATVTVKLANVQSATTADKEGKWFVKLPKFKAGGPYTLSIVENGKQESKLELSNVLIGDVWIASGQSNMEMQVQQAKDAKTEIAQANYPNIRLLMVDHDKKLSPQTDIRAGRWKVCDTKNVKDWSAVAYFFARKIHRDQNVPVGIVQSTWGGTPVEAWTSRDMLLTSPVTKERTLNNDTLRPDQFDYATDSLNWVHIWNLVYNPQNNADKIVPAQNYNDADWSTVEMPGVLKDFGIGSYDGMIWLRKKIILPESLSSKDLIINLGHPEMNYSLYFNGEEICKNIWNSNATHSFTIPARLVQQGENTIAVRVAMLWGGGGLNPPADDLYVTNGVSKISIAGKWVYKKDLETPFPKIMNYQYCPTVLFNAMIHPLIPYGIKGFIWYQGESNAWEAYNYRTMFPMLINDWRQRWQQGNVPFLFVQLANFMKEKSLPSESEWAELREAQTMTLSLPNTAMASAIDVGESNDIHPKNKQEVGRRLALEAEKIAYKHNIVSAGPVIKSSRITGNKITIDFNNAGKGLTTKDGKPVTGFAIAGDDKKFYWADATIKGNSVIVYSKNVVKPMAIRYAWADNPACNLTNKEGLPAVPFRTDSWKGITQK